MIGTNHSLIKESISLLTLFVETSFKRIQAMNSCHFSNRGKGLIWLTLCSYCDNCVDLRLNPEIPIGRYFVIPL